MKSGLMATSDRKRSCGNTMAKTAELVTTGAVAAAATSATVAGVGGAILPPLVGWAAGTLGRARAWLVERRLRQWLEQMAVAMEKDSADAVQEQIEANLNKAWMRDGLLESFRTLMDAIDESSIPPLARLAAQYIGKGQAPDVHFRSAGRLLAELDSSDLHTLQDLLLLISRREECQKCINVQVDRFNRNDVPRARISYRRHDGSAHEAEVRLNLHERLARVFGLLKRFDLGHDNPAGFYEVDSGPHVLVIGGTVLKRLIALLPPDESVDDETSNEVS